MLKFIEAILLRLHFKNLDKKHLYVSTTHSLLIHGSPVVDHHLLLNVFLVLGSGAILYLGIISLPECTILYNTVHMPTKSYILPLQFINVVVFIGSYRTNVINELSSDTFDILPSPGEIEHYLETS